MAEAPPIIVQQTIRKPVPWWAMAMGGVIVLVLVASLTANIWVTPLVRRAILRALEQNGQAEAQLGSLTVSLFPYPVATGTQVILRQRGRPGVPPVATVRRFEMTTNLLDLVRSPLHVRRLKLDGLKVVITGGGSAENSQEQKSQQASIVLGEIVADGSMLRIVPSGAGKSPLTYNIYRLTLHSVGADRSMRYRAQLDNATPPGLIYATGDFGPWEWRDPGQIPVSGDYHLDNADLSVFGGIAGQVSSVGKFRGVLAKIEVMGRTDSPDFTVNTGNHPVHLKTSFSATVDGINGNTLLHPVIAEFGSTKLIANGGITGEDGKAVTLDATVRDSNLADVLRLGLKSHPPMTGRVSFHASIRIPPGDGELARKMLLNGRFDIGHGKFTNPATQTKMASLSERAQGDTDSGGETPTATDIRGSFRVANGIVTLTNIAFHVPGGTLLLSGTYGLFSEKIDLRGTAVTEAKPSQMTKGVKSFLLKMLDPFFLKKKSGSTVLPVHVGGSKDNPSFEVKLKP